MKAGLSAETLLLDHLSGIGSPSFWSRGIEGGPAAAQVIQHLRRRSLHRLERRVPPAQYFSLQDVFCAFSYRPPDEARMAALSRPTSA